MFLLYIGRATDFFGVSRTREIYEKAIAVLEEKYMQDICLRFAELEKKLRAAIARVKERAGA